MQKVYAVWSGEYSDKDVIAVFASRELADRYAEIRNEREGYGEYEVAEYDLLDSVSTGSFPQMLTIWINYDYTKNKIANLHRGYRYGGNEDLEDVFGNIFSLKIHMPYTTDISELSNDKLLKIAQDRYAQYKARKEGVT